MRRFLMIIAILGTLSLYILALATGHGSKFAQYFWWILGFSSFLLLSLLFVLISQIHRLWQNRRRRLFGSQIAMRLSGMFVLVAVLPGLFLFGVSAQFISHSIQSWFGNETAEALERSLNLSRSALELAQDTTMQQAQSIQSVLAAEVMLQQDPAARLTEHAQHSQFTQLALYHPHNGQLAAQYNPQTLPDPTITADTFTTLNQNTTMRGLENINQTLYAQGWLLLPASNGRSLALFFRQPIPQQVAQDVNLIEAARARYAEISYAKAGLQTFFLFTLLVATLLAIFIALVIALYFAQRFTAPVFALAAAARSVAQGDYTPIRNVSRKDELGRLTTLFNHMTAQLDSARNQQENARRYLECILSGLSSGVISLDDTGHLKAWNESAEHILMVSLRDLEGLPPNQWHEHGINAAIAAELILTLCTPPHGDTQQLPYTAADEAKIILGRTTELPAENGAGLIVVFDDVTALVRAQKEAAWGEVAQRLAHEIRNPLTPIQLAAERLAWKLSDKLDTKSADILQRSTETIINQVSAMKGMVEAFRNYAQNPALTLERIDLNQLINELLVLYEGSNADFHAKLSPQAAWIQADTAAIRQVLHNLFKNGAEAAADNNADRPAQVEISTEHSDNALILTVCDNGKGFSEHMLHHAFDPYVTDKPTGTGLGLPVVKKIIEEHKGRIALSNRAQGGACVKITLPFPLESHEKQ